MTTEFVTLPRELTVGEALARLREMAETPNMIYYLYVVEGEGSWKLVGVIALRSLILADPSVPLADVMRTEFQTAHPDEPANEVAQRIAEYNLLALAGGGRSRRYSRHHHRRRCDGNSVAERLAATSAETVWLIALG